MASETVSLVIESKVEWKSYDKSIEDVADQIARVIYGKPYQECLGHAQMLVKGMKDVKINIIWPVEQVHKGGKSSNKLNDNKRRLKLATIYSKTMAMIRHAQRNKMTITVNADSNLEALCAQVRQEKEDQKQKLIQEEWLRVNAEK